MDKYIAIYARTSTDNQSSGLEAQILALKKYCEANAILNYKIFADEGISGSRLTRPSLDLLMQESEKGNISTVIVYSFSRFARSTIHLLDALNYFNKKSISFISLSEKLDTSSPMGRAVFTIISAISQLERELISERVKNGLRNAEANGKIIGRPKSVNIELIKELLLQEKYTYDKLASLAGCGSSSVGRIARELKSQKVV